MGYEAWHLEQKGKETDKGNRNREIRHDNAVGEIVRGNLANGRANGYELGEEHSEERIALSPDASPEMQHNHTLHQYIRTTTFRTLQVNAELITRMKAYGSTFIDKARDMGRNIFERFTRWADREMAASQRQQGEKGHER